MNVLLDDAGVSLSHELFDQLFDLGERVAHRYTAATICIFARFYNPCFFIDFGVLGPKPLVLRILNLLDMKSYWYRKKRVLPYCFIVVAQVKKQGLFV
jgi:hypothetical protein